MIPPSRQPSPAQQTLIRDEILGANSRRLGAPVFIPGLPAQPTDTPDLRFDQHLTVFDRKIRGQDRFASAFLYDSFIRYNMPV